VKGNPVVFFHTDPGRSHSIGVSSGLTVGRPAGNSKTDTGTNYQRPHHCFSRRTVVITPPNAAPGTTSSEGNVFVATSKNGKSLRLAEANATCKQQIPTHFHKAGSRSPLAKRGELLRSTCYQSQLTKWWRLNEERVLRPILCETA
jgi:hypothetical protein